MSRRITTGQKPFKMLVANFSGPTDPSKTSGQVISKKAKDKGTTLSVGEGNRIRSSFETQYFPEVSAKGFESQNRSGKSPGRSTRTGLLTYTAGVTPVAPLFSIEITATAVTSIGSTRIIIGEHAIIPGQDFAVDAVDPTVTAADIATYISTLPGYAAVPAGAVVNVEVPPGIDYNNMLLKVTGPESGGYTLSPLSGYPNKGEPYIGPSTIG